MWISIPKRHIVVWDSICSSISPEELDVRPTNIPPARAGDCGVYTLKYIECHALGIEFSKKDIAKASGKTMRDKMAVDIFQELPDAHEFENKDNDANLGAYEGLTVKSSGMLDELTISSLESLLCSDLL
ncbi:BnaCnng71950D [Brassica napus]|uniref:BnaCnng71950D protein n=1 Tax=Brassica napus TaxID=3708 RepID=A0A078JZY6_BRANA|nr:BnaCnng71950D [Brassica napus]